MRKSIKKSISIFLAALMLISVFSVTGAFAADTNKSASGDGTITLNASFCEEGGSAEWYAWTWNDESDGRWVQAIGGTSAADITYNADEFAANVLFARMNPAKHDILPSWNTETDTDIVWNQTEDTSVEVDGTFVIDSWGDGWGAKLTGHWEGGEPDIGENTASLDPGTAAEEGTVWCAWTWNEEHKSGAHWVEGTEENGIFKFEQLCSMVVFANFYAYTGNWEDKINQTDDITVEDGRRYTINDSFDTEDGARFIGEWGDDVDETSEPETEEAETTAPTEPETTAPATEEVIPTDPPAPDENENLYISAKSNINLTGSKVKVEGDNFIVSYFLKTSEKIDDGDFSVTYDTSKLTLVADYNTPASMFPVAKDAQYNLGAGPGTIKFNFSGVNGAYDFTGGGVLVRLVFTRKDEKSVGTAQVYLKASDLASKDKVYVDNGAVKDKEGVSVAQTIGKTEPVEPTTEDVKAASNPSLVINAYSNVSSEIQKITCDKPNVKVTYKMTVPEKLAYGCGVVTFDPSKLALEPKYNTENSMFTTISSNVVYNLNAASGTMMFNFTGVDADTNSGIYDFTKGGDIITLSFTVRDGAEGDTDVYLDLIDLGAFDTDIISDGAAKSEAAQITADIVLSPEISTTAPEGTSAPEGTTSDSSEEVSTQATTAADTTAPVTTEPVTAPPSTAPATSVQPAKSLGKGTSVAAADKFIKALKNDKDPKGSVFSSLKAKATKPGKNKAKVTWSKVKNAKGYIIYGNKCGKGYKKLKTVSATSYTQKKLKKGTYYKYLILAYDKNNKIITSSKTIHVATKGGKVGNHKSVKLNKTKKTLKKGKTFKLTATCIKENKKLKVKKHRAVKFESTNTKIATVTSKGKIKAKKKGKCEVYAYAQNGVYNKIKITVK